MCPWLPFNYPYLTFYYRERPSLDNLLNWKIFHIRSHNGDKKISKQINKKMIFIRLSCRLNGELTTTHFMKFNINLLIDAIPPPSLNYKIFGWNHLFFFVWFDLVAYTSRVFIMMIWLLWAAFYLVSVFEYLNISSKVVFYVCAYFIYVLYTYWHIGSAERAGYIMNQLLSIIIHSVFVLIYPFSVSLIIVYMYMMCHR